MRTLNNDAWKTTLASLSAARPLADIMDFLLVIRDIYKKGTDSFGFYPKLSDDQLSCCDRVIHHENGFITFNPKLLLHIKKGKNVEVVQFLKEQEDACYTVDSFGATLLHYAAQYHNAILTKRFINSGYNIDALDNHENTPLLYAVPADKTIYDRMTISATQKLIKTVEVLLNEGANVHMVNKNGDCVLPIVFQYSKPRFSSIVTMILEKVKEESPNNNQVIARKLFAANCPLPLALRLGGLELTKEMLVLGSSVESCDRITGETALHEAVGLSDLESVKLLLERNANVNAVDFEKRGPLMKFDTRCDETSEMIEILKTLIDRLPGLDMELIKKFLSHGKKRTALTVTKRSCDMFARNEYGETSVHFLARNPNPGIIDEVLRGKEFEVDARDKYGNTPMMDATRAGHTHAVEFLLDHKANPNIADCDGIAPLHSVFHLDSRFKNSHVEIVELLMNHGAEVQCSSRKETIFDLASAESHRRLVTPVLAHLAKLEAEGRPLDKSIRANIDRHEGLRNDYVSYKQQLAEMKMYTVHGMVTLYDLLTESDEELRLYASDREFVYSFEALIDNKYMSSYYLDVIKRRVDKVIGRLEAESSAGSVCSIM